MQIGSITPKALEWHPSAKADGSGIGINYVDEVLKGFGNEIQGAPFKVKRRGLKLSFVWGDKKSEALLKRMDHGPEVDAILIAALNDGFGKLGLDVRLEGSLFFMHAGN